jgi:hypothetical protein
MPPYENDVKMLVLEFDPAIVLPPVPFGGVAELFFVDRSVEIGWTTNFP